MPTEHHQGPGGVDAGGPLMFGGCPTMGIPVILAENGSGAVSAGHGLFGRQSPAACDQGKREFPQVRWAGWADQGLCEFPQVRDLQGQAGTPLTWDYGMFPQVREGG